MADINKLFCFPRQADTDAIAAAPAAWGGRFIVTQDGQVDLPHDRHSADDPEHLLAPWFNDGGAWRAMFDALENGLRDRTIDTREFKLHILYEDERGVIVADTQGSAGYCYVAAYLRPAEVVVEPATHDYDTTQITPAEPPAKARGAIMATFRAQAWVRGHAVDIDDGEYEFDITDQVLALGRDAALAIKDHTFEADDLWHKAQAAGRVPPHNGPFEVEVEEAIAAYFGVDLAGQIDRILYAEGA